MSECVRVNLGLESVFRCDDIAGTANNVFGQDWFLTASVASLIFDYRVINLQHTYMHAYIHAHTHTCMQTDLYLKTIEIVCRHLHLTRDLRQCKHT